MSIYQGLASNEGQKPLFAAWKGEVGDDRLFYSQYDGTQWAPQTTIDGNSSVGPALAFLGSTLVAVWKGEHGDDRIFFAKFANGAWGPPAQIPNLASDTGPSLAPFGNSLYAAWRNSGSDQSLHYASFDGNTWSAPAPIPNVASSIGPSLATLGGKLYAAWKGSANDQGLWYASFDGNQWSSQASIPGVASSVGPSLANCGGTLYAAWKGESGDDHIYYASFDGSSWSSQSQIPNVASSIGPALVHFGGQLCAMWKGDDMRLWFAFFDGKSWSAQANIPGNTGQDLPQNIGLRMQYQESSEWCWIAVATSINHFYTPASTLTQCAVMTAVGQTINKFPQDTSACPSAAAVASVPGLAAKLANPYTAAAEYVLDNPSLGIPTEYLKTGGVGDALNVKGNWNGSRNAPALNSITLAQIQTEIGAGRPIAVDIAWNGGQGAHCVAIAGVLDDMLLICDPVYGESVVQYESFPAAYQGGATLVGACLTKKGS